MKKLMLVILLFVFTSRSIVAQETKVDTNKQRADAYWASMPIKWLVFGTTRNMHSKSAEELKQSELRMHIYNEMRSRAFRDWGIEFWKRFPNDPRRFEWFRFTCINEPAYFANIREGAIAKLERRFVLPLDTTAKKEWKALFQGYLKEFLISKDVDDSKKKHLLQGFIEGVSMHKWRVSKQEKFDFYAYFDQVKNFINQYGKAYTSMAVRYLAVIVRDKQEYGLDNNDVVKFIELLKSTEFNEFHKLAVGYGNLKELERVPLSFYAKSISGAEIDLKKYRGKLVLLDFWDLGCSTCIAKMPEIKDVYERYKDKGFEVISACSISDKKIKRDGKEYDQRELIMDVYHKVGADWPLVLLGTKQGEQGRVIFDTYNWKSVPQLLLLDEEGKLIYYQGDMLFVKGGLERLVKEHLEARAD